MSDQTTAAAIASGPATADEEAARLADKLSGNETLSDVAGKITQLPAGVKLSSNLDTYEKEKPTEEFWFQHEDQFFRMVDPDEVDFQDIVIGQENPRLMMHVLIEPEQRDEFFSKRLPVGKMKKLIRDYTRHFGLTDLGELAGSARS